MSKPKNYFVNFKKIETGGLSRGILVQAKCERSALFYINATYLNAKYKNEVWKINRLVEINNKVYNRLKHLEELRIKKEKEYEERAKNKRSKNKRSKKYDKEIMKHVALLASCIPGPYRGGL